MKNFIIVALLFISTNANAIGIYSTGYRMGQLTKFSIKGIFTKSGEGEMLVGSESTPLIITSTDSEGNTTRKVINPWKFSSTNKSMQDKLASNIGDYVYVTYKQAQVHNPLGTDTDYEITSVNSIESPINKVCIANAYEKGSKSTGTRVGRVIKASSKGTFVKSYEITMQQGNSGNQFHKMSISKDKELYKCAIDYLKAGQKVKIYYSQSLLNLSLSRSTTYDIVKIEPVKGLN